MHNNIRQILDLYSDATLNIITSVEKGDFETVKKLFAQRQECLDILKGIEFDKDEFKKMLQEKKIFESEEKLRQTIKFREKELSDDMRKTCSANRVIINYIKNKKPGEMNLFNEKI